MKYGIIGTGAIGGYYGAKLAHAGQEVHVLLHGQLVLEGRGADAGCGG